MNAAKDYPTRDTSLVGAAGVHAVVSELSLRGLIALPTIRNTAGVDVIVSNRTGTWHANLQVKTSRSRVSFWPVGTKYAEWVRGRQRGQVSTFDKWLSAGQAGHQQNVKSQLIRKYNMARPFRETLSSNFAVNTQVKN